MTEGDQLFIIVCLVKKRKILNQKNRTFVTNHKHSFQMHKLLFLVFSLPLVVNFCGDGEDLEDLEYGSLTNKVTEKL